jgi:UDP-N-acetylglucosamine 2-epimerase
MFDALLYNARLAAERSEALSRLELTPGQYALATVHRPRNTDDSTRLEAILSALEEIGRSTPVVFPVHPRTRQAIADLTSSIPDPDTANCDLRLIEPVGYLDMLALEQGARMVLTDSGGVQKEAYLFEKPCITLREETEWVETVQAGWNLLVGADCEAIVAAARDFRPRGTPPRVFGDGRASQKIVDLLTG